MTKRRLSDFVGRLLILRDQQSSESVVAGEGCSWHTPEPAAYPESNSILTANDGLSMAR